MNQFRANFWLFLFSTAVCLGGAEGLLRAAGREPWAVSSKYAHVPVVTAPHPHLGWVNKPGDYTYSVTDDGENIVRYQIDAEGRRVISPGMPEGKPEVWIFGCSFSFGWAVTGGEEFASRAAVLHPGLVVSNYSVPGYGTYQSLLRYEELLRSGKSAPTIVYGFAAFHDERNVAAYEWLKNIRRFGRGQHWISTPFALLGPDGSIVRHEPVTFAVFPFSEHSDLLTAAQEQWGRFAAGGREKNDREVTLALIQQFSREAAAHGARFIALGLSMPRDGDYYFRELMKSGVEYLDVSRYGALTPARMVPGDNIHPNARIHALWGEALGSYLTDPANERRKNRERYELVSKPGDGSIFAPGKAESDALNGVVERRGGDNGDAVISGWVFDRTAPENFVAVAAGVDGKELARAGVETARDDVVQVFHIDVCTKPGFELRIPRDALGGRAVSEVAVVAISQSGAARRLTDLSGKGG